MSSKHITYLFGAGASWQAMPIYSELSKEIRRVGNIVTSHPKGREVFGEAVTFFEGLDMDVAKDHHFSEVHEELISEADEFQSIDTFAKYLWIRNEDSKLIILKKLVSWYFVLRHFANRHLEENPEKDNRKRTFSERDKRIDSLFAAILDNSAEMPSNISFLTWNYDLLLEEAFVRFTRPDDDHGIRLSKAAISNTPLLHLNGHCPAPPNHGESRRSTKSLDRLKIDVSGSTIQYAWEMSDEKRAELDSLLSKTTHLVVIGYSFPVFNRDIDRQILAAPNLKKVYIQDVPDALPGIGNRVRALLGSKAKDHYKESNSVLINKKTRIPAQVQIELIDSVDQFHIPFELI